MLAYRLLGTSPTSPSEWVMMYALPVAIPAVLAPIVLRRGIRFTIEMREKNARLEEEIVRRRAAEARLEELATIDDLTQVVNRRTFFTRAAELAEASERVHCVIVIDLDHFKTLNDTYGHPTGDHALQMFGQVLVSSVVGDNVIGRLGGEEFGVIMVDSTPEQALAVCETMRLRTAETVHQITASFGLTDWAPVVEGVDAAIGRADAALYRAKQRGRNRTELIKRGDDQGSLISDLAPIARR